MLRAQFFGPAQVKVAPRARFGLIAELFQGIGLQSTGLLVIGVGKHQMVDHLSYPAVVALGKGLTGFSQQGFGPTHKVNVILGSLLRRQGVQVGRIAVKKAQITLVNGFYVMVDAAVIPSVVPSPEQLCRQLDDLRDFQHRVTLIGQPQGFIVQIFVHVALLFQKLNTGVCSPRRPVMAGEN